MTALVRQFSAEALAMLRSRNVLSDGWRLRMRLEVSPAVWGAFEKEYGGPLPTDGVWFYGIPCGVSRDLTGTESRLIEEVAA